jgi:signal peptidase
MKIVQKIIGKIVNVLIVLVIIAIIICAYSVFSVKVLNKGYVNFFGYSIFEVATGSMKEEIDVGDAVLVKIDSDFEVGDIVTYQSGEDYITHRVVSKTDNYVITKGDANNVNDNPIDKSLVLGKVVKIMPKVGVWKKVILTPKVIVLILLTLFVFSILFSYDGSSIKIVSSKKAQKEIDQKIEDEVNKKVDEEVNKKVAVINRKKKRVKKVLDATQILDINEVKTNGKKKKTLDATQIIDISDINRK